MEHHGGAQLDEQLAHARGVLAVREHCARSVEVAPVLELSADLEETVLAVLHEDQLTRAHARYLARQLSAD